jgi:transposase-like protein
MKYSEEEKAMWLEDWRQSGKGAWAYAKENGIIPQTFTNWTKEETENGSGLIEVPAVAATEWAGQEILIETVGVKIHVPLGIGREELRTIVRALGGAA